MEISASNLLFLAKSDVQTGVGEKHCEAVWSLVVEAIVFGDID